jgi:hypothetical protein
MSDPLGGPGSMGGIQIPYQLTLIENEYSEFNYFIRSWYIELLLLIVWILKNVPEISKLQFFHLQKTSTEWVVRGLQSMMCVDGSIRWHIGQYFWYCWWW